VIRTALTMIVGDRPRFIGMICGLGFASLLMTLQGGIYLGVMSLVYGHVSDTPQAQVWVCDPGMPEFDTTESIHERELDNVRAVSGVRWAVPLDRRALLARLPGGQLSTVVVIGVDDATLIGAPLPTAMLTGSSADLRRSDAVVIDQRSAESKLRVPCADGTSRPLRIGDHLLLSGRQVTVAGFCRSTPSINLWPTVYMLRSRSSALDPGNGDGCNFILVGLDTGADATAVCTAISTATGLGAYPREEFCQRTYDFYLRETGIPINFGIAVLLGFLVGAAIAGQTFSQFVTDNRRIFATLKAMGMYNRRLAAMLIVQALAMAGVGFGLGAGAATVIGSALDGTDLACRLQPALLLQSFIAVLAISLVAALLSLRSVMRVDPALVFRS